MARPEVVRASPINAIELETSQPSIRVTNRLGTEIPWNVRVLGTNGQICVRRVVAPRGPVGVSSGKQVP